MRANSILVLDIETDIPEPRQAIDLCSPLLLGFKHFVVRDGQLEAGTYCHVEPKHFRKALLEIGRFRGPIVGYNLLGFDYVILREFGDLRLHFRRTVDLLDFLAGKFGRRRGLGLGRVCESLFGEGKDRSLRSSLAALWHAGRRDEVLAYNDRDLDLTARLWHRLRTSRALLLDGETLRLSPSDHSFLDGRKPISTYNDWMSRTFEEQRLRTRKDAFQGLHVNPIDLAYAYDRYICTPTGEAILTRLVPESDFPSGEDTKPRTCPLCGEYVWHSPYIFKPRPCLAGSPILYGRAHQFGVRWGSRQVDDSQLADVWEIVRPHLSRWNEGHLIVEGVPRRERVEVPNHDDLGIDEHDFERWLAGVRREPSLRRFVPQFKTVVSYVSRRGLAALQAEAMENF
jgi:hypothetical protein